MDLALRRATDEREEPVHRPRVFDSLAVAKLQRDGPANLGRVRVGGKGIVVERIVTRSVGDRRTHAKQERSDANRRARIEPARSASALGPTQTGAAAQIDDEHSPADHLKPGMSQIDFGVRESDVAGVVAAHEGEWLVDCPFGQYTPAG